MERNYMDYLKRRKTVTTVKKQGISARGKSSKKSVGKTINKKNHHSEKPQRRMEK